MRLRQIEFPIAILRPNSLMGGRNAGLHTVRRFSFNIADYYLKGGYDAVTIYDSLGREFAINRIEMRKPHWVHYFLQRADNLFIFPINDKTDMVSIDMVLTETRQLSLEHFCNELRDLALENPAWWKRHSSRSEIEGMFLNCQNIAEAIEQIGVLDPPGREKLLGQSTKVVDLRT